ncbi:MAG TPA: hypothetical protein VF306_22895 [Pirellulales bacterium]
MASSENQGLQIALIIFVMLTILLSVTTFMFFRSYTDEALKSKSNADAASQKGAALSAAEADLTAIRGIIGVPDSAKLSDITEIKNKDMQTFVSTAPEESQRYHQAVEFLASTLNAKTEELVAARDQIAQEQAQRQKVEESKQAQVDAALKKVEEAEQAKDAAEKQFNDERAKMLADNKELQDQLAAKNEAFAKLEAEKNKQIESLAAEQAKLQRFNDSLTEKNQQLDPTSGFEVPDGAIVWVNQKMRAAYINVGSADGLRRQTTFSVVGSGDDIGEDQKTKGRVEVVNILGPHFAQCKIIEDHLTDPLVQGDKIYTPLWHPGRGEGFGIIGVIDIDGDGLDDRDMIRDLIRMNGGRIDAEDDPTGKSAKQTGQLTLETRYLVRGKPPADKQVEGAWTKMQEDAQRMGIRVIGIDKFLDQMGWKDQKQVLRYGRRGNANEVPAAEPDGGRPQSSGNVSGSFRVRRPPGKRGIGSTQPSAGSSTETPGAKRKSAY